MRGAPSSPRGAARLILRLHSGAQDYYTHDSDEFLSGLRADAGLRRPRALGHDYWRQEVPVGRAAVDGKHGSGLIAGEAAAVIARHGALVARAERGGGAGAGGEFSPSFRPSAPSAPPPPPPPPLFLYVATGAARALRRGARGRLRARRRRCPARVGAGARASARGGAKRGGAGGCLDDLMGKVVGSLEAARLGGHAPGLRVRQLARAGTGGARRGNGVPRGSKADGLGGWHEGVSFLRAQRACSPRRRHVQRPQSRCGRATTRVLSRPRTRDFGPTPSRPQQQQQQQQRRRRRRPLLLLLLLLLLPPRLRRLPLLPPPTESTPPSMAPPRTASASGRPCKRTSSTRRPPQSLCPRPRPCLRPRRPRPRR